MNVGPAFRWQKLGKVFTPQEVPGRPWMSEFAQAPATLLLDDVVRVYFSCRPPADKNGQYVSYGAYVDLDRTDLFRIVRVADEPILGLGGLGEFDEFGTYPISVIRAGDEIRAYYGGWTRCESVPFNVAIGCSTSRTRAGRSPSSGPALCWAIHSTSPSYSADRRSAALMVSGICGTSRDANGRLDGGRPEPVYKIRAATSDDGIHWTPMNRDLIESRIEEDEAQASPDVSYSGGTYHMFFCYRGSRDYRGKANGYRIGYASSTDLVHWSRDDARAGIDVSDAGWDAEMVSYPHVFDVDGRTYMAYLGDQVGRYGFGLAVLDGTLG